MKNLSEVHGVDLIKRLADEKFRDPVIRKRVWSDEMHAWGFFAESPTEMDTFMIMGCCRPGDMYVAMNNSRKLFKVPCHDMIETTSNNPHIILGLKYIEISGTYVYALELLSSNPTMICQMLAQHASLFKIAWQCLPNHAM